MNANIRQARDEWIALRCQNGEPRAFADLVGEMERPLLYFAQKLVNDEDKALDVLQEVWLKAFQTIGRLEKPGLVRAWLYRLTRGLAIDRVRKDMAERRRVREHAEERTEMDDGADPSFDEEDASVLHRALDSLEIQHREVLVLHFLEELTVSEIAGIVGCPEGTVKSRIYYAKRALHTALRGEDHGKAT
jgi:RNA polymerase sigma-70 factor (ECF subfamily)